MAIFKQTPSRGLDNSSCRFCPRRALPMSDRCELHLTYNPVPDRNSRQPYRKHYTSAEYRRNKARRFELARGLCEVCGRELGPGQWHAHHVVPISAGGTDDLENLRVLCSFVVNGRRLGCHSKAHRS